jgi:DNA-binding NtrC family response regulator
MTTTSITDMKDRDLNLGKQTASILTHVDELKKLADSLSVQHADFLAGLRNDGSDRSASLLELVRNFEISLIRGALIRASGVQSLAARELRISPTTLHWKIKRYGLTKRDFSISEMNRDATA